MSNDETRPLPTEGSPPSPWATTEPVAAPTSPYGPAVSAHPAPAASTQPAAGWPAAEPDPWVDVTPARSGYAATLAAPEPQRPGQRRQVLGIIGLVAAGAVAGALVVNTVGGFGASDAAAVQPGSVTQNGAAPNGVNPGGAQGGVQDGVPGGRGLRGGPGGQDGEQRVVGTLTAVSGSTVTVQTPDGPATYQLASQTQIVRDGALASVSNLKAGDRVLVHVFPANGSDGVLERLIAVSDMSGTQGTEDDGTADA
jgi:hypothetical protein